MTDLKKIFNKNFIYLGIISIVSILMCFVPLTNVIGYEYSASISIIISFISGLKIIGFRKKLSSLYGFRDVLKAEILFFSLLFIIPLIISVANTLLFQVCPPWHGLLFYILFVPPAMLVGFSIGACVLTSFGKFQIPIYLLIYIIVLLFPLIEIYFRPQIYLYHSIFTFFPGTIYDDLIKIDNKMILFRAFSLLPFVLVLIYALSIRNQSERISYLPFISFLIFYSGYFLLKPVLGFSTTVNTLQENLSNHVVTSNFIISYPPSLNEDQVNNLILHHEFYFDKISKQSEIEYKNKIHSFVFKNRDQKRDLFGAGNADVAKPWLNQIYTQYESYGSSLKHEISHVFASEIGSTIFKVADNFNPSMIEGYAMAIENNYSGYDIHYLATIAKQAGYEISIPQLFEGFNFLAGTSSISYIYAGSFIKFLIDEFGIQKINKLYSDLDFEKHIGMDLNDLSEVYFNFLETLNYAPDSSKAQYFFGRQSLFKRNCPRVTAQNIHDGWEHYRNSEYKSAYKLFNQTYQYSASYSALNGSIESLIKLKDFVIATQIINTEISNFDKSGYHFNLLFRQADLFGFNREFQKADSVYSNLISNRPNEIFGIAARSRLLLLREFPKLYTTYIHSESSERFFILSEIINKNNYETLLPVLLNIANSANISESSINRIISNLGIDNNPANYFFYERMSEWYLEKNNWDCARYYSQLANVVVKKFNSPVSNENLEKSEWFFNFADSILKNITYK